MITALSRIAVGLIAVLGWITASTAGEPDWPDHLTIGTASPGGTYYVYGEGVAKILTRALDLPVNRLATEGPVQNIALLEAGDIQLAFVTTGVALQAWNATGVWAGRPPARSLRALFPMYDTPFQFLVLQESGINAIAGIAGKRVATTRSSTAAELLREIKANVYEFTNIRSVYNALLDNTVDAVVFDAPVLLYYAANEGKGRVAMSGPLFHSENYGLVFPQNSPLLKQVDGALIALRQDGTYQQLYDKWFTNKQVK